MRAMGYDDAKAMLSPRLIRETTRSEACTGGNRRCCRRAHDTEAATAAAAATAKSRKIIRKADLGGKVASERASE